MMNNTKINIESSMTRIAVIAASVVCKIRWHNRKSNYLFHGEIDEDQTPVRLFHIVGRWGYIDHCGRR